MFLKHKNFYVIFIKGMNYSFKNILITGCTGLLGSWMAESLLKSDITIKGVALNQDLDFLLKSKGLLNEFEIKYLDISDKKTEIPIGVSCRTCDRLDCSQRAFPPLHKKFDVDINNRGVSVYVTE